MRALFIISLFVIGKLWAMEITGPLTNTPTRAPITVDPFAGFPPTLITDSFPDTDSFPYKGQIALEVLDEIQFDEVDPITGKTHHRELSITRELQKATSPHTAPLNPEMDKSISTADKSITTERGQQYLVDNSPYSKGGYYYTGRTIAVQSDTMKGIVPNLWYTQATAIVGAETPTGEKVYRFNLGNIYVGKKGASNLYTFFEKVSVCSSRKNTPYTENFGTLEKRYKNETGEDLTDQRCAEKYLAANAEIIADESLKETVQEKHGNWRLPNKKITYDQDNRHSETAWTCHMHSQSGMIGDMLQNVFKIFQEKTQNLITQAQTAKKEIELHFVEVWRLYGIDIMGVSTREMCLLCKTALLGESKRNLYPQTLESIKSLNLAFPKNGPYWHITGRYLNLLRNTIPTIHPFEVKKFDTTSEQRLQLFQKQDDKLIIIERIKEYYPYLLDEAFSEKDFEEALEIMMGKYKKRKKSGSSLSKPPVAKKLKFDPTDAKPV